MSVVSVGTSAGVRGNPMAVSPNLQGASARLRTVNGICHAGDRLFEAAMPDVFNATIRDIKAFADSL
jgi:hypothetical protein